MVTVGTSALHARHRPAAADGERAPRSRSSARGTSPAPPPISPGSRKCWRTAWRRATRSASYANTW